MTENKHQQPNLKKGTTRREFLKFCGTMAAALALPKEYAQVIADALAAGPRVPVVWMEFQGCTGDTESFLRAAPRTNLVNNTVSDPGITHLLTEVLSVEYHETLATPSGFAAEKSLNDVVAKYAGKFVAVVEGSIPTANGGVTCTVAGQTALSRAQAILPKARAVIAAGSCSVDGGLAAAAPNPTGATGVASAVPGLTNLVNLPGCPANVVNIVSTIVYLATFNQLPDRDSAKRPYFAYGQEIHERCERHDHYESDRFVRAWGDAGHRAGWCLYLMGCRGPETKSNCARVKWNSGSSWPVAAGHGCVGCTTPNFWDRQTPFYTPLQDD